MTKLAVPASPCTSCPYRRDVPSGVWHPEEYEKLRRYDEGASDPATAAFLCHYTPTIGEDTVCRGWLTVHRESIAARLAEIMGAVTPEERYAEVKEPLYSSGNEAADAGLHQVRRPSAKAQKLIHRLVKKQAKDR